jgi:hypothetical protein
MYAAWRDCTPLSADHGRSRPENPLPDLTGKPALVGSSQASPIVQLNALGLARRCRTDLAHGMLRISASARSM